MSQGSKAASQEDGTRPLGAGKHERNFGVIDDHSRCGQIDIAGNRGQRRPPVPSLRRTSFRRRI